MELNVFLRELESALVQRGVPNETALKQVANVRRSITSDDLSDIENLQSNEEINQMADSLVVILNRNRAKQSSGPAPVSEVYPAGPAPQEGQQQYPEYPDEPTVSEPPPSYPVQEEMTETAPAKEYPSQQYGRNRRRDPEPQDYEDESSYDDDDFEDVPRHRKKAEKNTSSRNAPRKSNKRDDVDDYFEYSPDSEPSAKGMILFWVGLFLTLPITIALAVAMFGAFGAVFVALAALIVVSILAVIALVSVGSVSSLVAVVFGLTQLFHIGEDTSVIAGIYEIGLGVMVAGLVLFFAVLLYNFAIRFLPWVISKVGVFLKFLCRKIKDLFLYIRRGCYQL